MKAKPVISVLAGALTALPLASAGQNLFVSTYGGNNILEYTPQGVQSTFAFGLSAPKGLAFDSTGNLFEADYGSHNIYEFTPQGVESIFASGLTDPYGLAFDGAGNLYAASYGGGLIYKFSPQGVESIFASGLPNPVGLAFAPATVPEPSAVALALSGIGLLGVLFRHRRQDKEP